jgi:hypothetical protein
MPEVLVVHELLVVVVDLLELGFDAEVSAYKSIAAL